MPTSLAIRIVFWIWLLAAVAAGHYLVLQRLPQPATPAILLGLTGALILAYRGLAAFRTWVDALDLRAVVLLHVTRFVGFYFLTLYNRGELPHAFAVPGGIGDIVVAVFAIVVVAFPLAESTRLRAIYVWNVVGFVDLLLVVLSAARLGLATPREMLALTRLPLSLLPTFLVPLLLATHVLIFARLARANR